jgi:4-methyl-5(b-hydroxyethyl)-thiazole monophosphate biosynthesis
VTKEALLILAEGFEEIEAVAPIDVLTRAGVHVTVAGLVDGPVRAAYGTTIMPDIPLSAAFDEYDAVIFPGGRKNAQSLAADRRAVAMARTHAASGKLVAAICAAPSHVLGEAAGLLKGVRATGDPSFNDKLAASGAIITNEMVTRDRNFITGMGPGAALLFAVTLADYLAGPEIAQSFAAKWGLPR